MTVSGTLALLPYHTLHLKPTRSWESLEPEAPLPEGFRKTGFPRAKRGH